MTDTVTIVIPTMSAFEWGCAYVTACFIYVLVARLSSDLFDYIKWR